MLLVHMGDDSRAEEFFARFWPDASAVADPELELYSAFGLESRPLRSLASPRYLVAATRSVLTAGMGRPHGDVMRMPGAFVVRGGRVTWSHPFRHFGDHPPLEAVLRAVAE